MSLSGDCKDSDGFLSLESQSSISEIPPVRMLVSNTSILMVHEVWGNVALSVARTQRRGFEPIMLNQMAKSSQIRLLRFHDTRAEHQSSLEASVWGYSTSVDSSYSDQVNPRSSNEWPTTRTKVDLPQSSMALILTPLPGFAGSSSKDSKITNHKRIS